MARNKRFTLDRSQAGSVGGYTQAIRRYAATGRPLTVDFTKDDGTNRVISGAFVELKGQGSHSVVTILTDKGHRSAHLYSINELEIAE